MWEFEHWKKDELSQKALARIAELEAENAALKKQVEVLGRIAERQPSLAAKCFPNPYKL